MDQYLKTRLPLPPDDRTAVRNKQDGLIEDFLQAQSTMSGDLRAQRLVFILLDCVFMPHHQTGKLRPSSGHFLFLFLINYFYIKLVWWPGVRNSIKLNQTCHSIEMENLDLTNKKIGIWGKKSGSWSNRLQKEITHPKRRLFVVSFFGSATRNVLICQISLYEFFSCLFCLCVLFLFSCLFPQTSQ